MKFCNGKAFRKFDTACTSKMFKCVLYKGIQIYCIVEIK